MCSQTNRQLRLPMPRGCFFAEFLQTTGLFKSWVDRCPLKKPVPALRSNRMRWVRGVVVGHFGRYFKYRCLPKKLLSKVILLL